MRNNKNPKQLLFGGLANGKQPAHKLNKPHKNGLKETLNLEISVHITGSYMQMIVPFGRRFMMERLLSRVFRFQKKSWKEMK